MNPLDVKIARIRAGIQIKKMAADLGLNPKTLSAYELGRRKFPPHILERVIDYLKDHNPEGKES